MSATVCGRCSAPVAAGVAFCGRCGAAVAGGAMATTTFATAPAGYPYAAVRTPMAAHRKLGPAVLVGGGGVVLAVVIVLVSLLAHASEPAQAAQCTVFSCGSPQGQPVLATQDYHSTALGFDVHYPPEWKAIRSAADRVELQLVFVDPTDPSHTAVAGEGIVFGKAAGESGAQLIADAVGQLPSASFQGVKQIYTIPGARVGQVAGSGAVFDANVVSTTGQAQHVRIAVLAATQGSVSIVVVGVEPFADQSPPPGQFAAAFLIDFLLNQTVFP